MPEIPGANVRDMNDMKDTDWAYLAGLIDGEGHLGIEGPQGPGVMLVITNSSVVLMDWLESHMPVGKKYSLKGSKNGVKRPVWQWWIWNEDILPIVSAVMPYLIAKREEAEVILLALDERKRYSYALGTGHHPPQSFRIQMKELRDRLLSIRSVKGDTSSDIPSVSLPIPLFDM